MGRRGNGHEAEMPMTSRHSDSGTGAIRKDECSGLGSGLLVI
jgi:hypothetical protein